MDRVAVQGPLCDHFGLVAMAVPDSSFLNFMGGAHSRIDSIGSREFCAGPIAFDGLVLSRVVNSGSDAPAPPSSTTASKPPEHF